MLSSFLIELPGFLKLNCIIIIIIIAMAMTAEQGYWWIIIINMNKKPTDIAEFKLSLIADS